MQQQNLKGFRDFLPAEKRKRDFVAASMSKSFQKYGYEPIETPTLEYASLLLGKYGLEADKLVYTFEDRGERQVGLRYDQTVPTARFLGQYQAQLPKYFRRYQIQNVFRADKPQAGRFREFTQCDCDIFGSTSAVADAEILAVYYATFADLGLSSLVIELNDRETLLATLSPFTITTVDVFSIIQSIDKLDKLSEPEVIDELVKKGLQQTAATACLVQVKNSTISSNLKDIVQKAISLGVPAENLKIHPTLARGLDYYTGMIFEGKIPEYTVGSVGGGGRYNNLLKDLMDFDCPAVGFGIGFDRTVEAADQLGLLPSAPSTQVLVTIFDETPESITSSLEAAQQLRVAGIATEVFPEVDKIGKQLKLADQKKIPYVLVIGESERAQDQVTLKQMDTGEQTQLHIEAVIERLA